MSIQQFEPIEIMFLLSNRLNSTNDLFDKRDIDNIEQEKILFFKYFFDISSAIESCLRGIISEYSKIEIFGNTIKRFGKPEDDSVAFLLKYEDFIGITNNEKILIGRNNEDFKNKYMILIKMFCSSIPNYLYDNYVFVVDTYKKIRKTRNTLAHGIKAMGSNVEFTKEHLMEFVYIFYLVHSYYEEIYSNEYTINSVNKK